jgi:hypothetical protein
MTGLHDFALPEPQSGLGRETNVAQRHSAWTLERKVVAMGIIEIVVIVLIVLFVVGYFGRGRFRA